MDKPYSIMNIDLSKEFKELGTDVQHQVRSYYEVSKNFKNQYLKQEEEQLNRLEHEPSVNDSIFVPAVTDMQKKIDDKIVSYFNKSIKDEDIPVNQANYFYRYQDAPESQDLDLEKITKLRKIMKNQRANLTDIAKYVRIVPTVLQLLKSPFYRTELAIQFEKWRKLRKDIINEKLSQEDKKDLGNFDLEELNKNAEGITEENKAIDKALEKALEQIETMREHLQNVKIGGILKNMLDLWTIEDIFQACIICTFWICGQITLSHITEEDSVRIKLNFKDEDIIYKVEEQNENSLKTLEKEFIESMVEEPKNSSNKNFNKHELITIVKLTFSWISEIHKSKMQLDQYQKEEIKSNLSDSNIYKKLDMGKVEAKSLNSFIEEIDNIEMICENLEEHNPIFKELNFEIGDGLVLDIPKSFLKNIVIAENNVYHTGSEATTYQNDLRSFDEINDTHLIIWFISNLLLQDKRHLQTRKKFTYIEGEMKDIISKIQTNNKDNDFELLDEKKLAEEMKKEDGEGESPEEMDSPEQMDYNPPGNLETYSNIHNLSTYIPLTKVANHFYKSITDQLWLQQQAGNAQGHDQLLSEYCKESQIKEITYEILMVFSIMEMTEETKAIFTNDKIEQSSITGEHLLEIFLDSVKKYIPVIEFDRTNKKSKKHLKLQDFYEKEMFSFSKSFKKSLEKIVRDFLDGKLDKSLESRFSQLLLNEIYIDITRSFNNSNCMLVISKLTNKYGKKIQEAIEGSDTIDFKYHSLLAELKQNVLDDNGYEEQGIPKPYYISNRFDVYFERFNRSEKVAKVYKEIFSNIQQTMDQILCQHNAQIQWDKIFERCEKVLDNLNKEGKNNEVKDSLRIIFNTKRKRYEFKNKTLKKDWKYLRRFLPEFKNKNEVMVISKDIWDKIWPLIEKSHWKVQIGIITWWALVVEDSPWEDAVMCLLKRANMSEANTRQAAIKIMGVFSEFFKLFKNELEMIGISIPWWVFSGSDCIFGYTETDSEEHLGWQKEVLDSVISWIGKRKNEHFASLDLQYDLEMSMEHFLKDFKIALSKGISY